MTDVCAAAGANVNPLTDDVSAGATPLTLLVKPDDIDAAHTAGANEKPTPELLKPVDANSVDIDVGIVAAGAKEKLEPMPGKPPAGANAVVGDMDVTAGVHDKPPAPGITKPADTDAGDIDVADGPSGKPVDANVTDGAKEKPPPELIEPADTDVGNTDVAGGAKEKPLVLPVKPAGTDTAGTAAKENFPPLMPAEPAETDDTVGVNDKLLPELSTPADTADTDTEAAGADVSTAGAKEKLPATALEPADSTDAAGTDVTAVLNGIGDLNRSALVAAGTPSGRVSEL